MFQRFFERVVELCRAAGLVWGRELFFDATKVRADAAVDSLVPRFYWKWKTTGGAVRRAAPRAAPACRGGGAGPRPLPRGAHPGPAPAAGRPRHPAPRWSLLDECRLDPERPPNSAYQRYADRQVSATDPDAALMNSHRRAAPRLGYQTHYVVDGGRDRIILHALTTPGDVMEGQALQDLLWRVRFRWRVHPRRAVGDSKYGTVANILALEDAGIRAYFPLADTEHREGPVLSPGGLPLRRRPRHLLVPAGAPAAAVPDRLGEGVRRLRRRSGGVQRLPGAGRVHAGDDGPPRAPLPPRRLPRPGAGLPRHRVL